MPAVRMVVPVPACESEPAPLIALETRLLSLPTKESRLPVAMLTVELPRVPLLVTWRTPPVMRVPPE